MNDIKYEIIERIAVLSGRGNWTKELNLISWDGRPPKYDIRDWNHESGKIGKGTTLSEEEMQNLREVIVKLDLGL